MYLRLKIIALLAIHKVCFIANIYNTEKEGWRERKRERDLNAFH